MTVIYFVDNKLGGVTSLNYNLISHPPKDVNPEQVVIHIDQEELEMSRADINFPADKEIFFHYFRDENTYHILKRLHDLVPGKEGAMILNYENEMAMLDHYPTGYTTYQLVHDNYNLKLSKKYGHVVDVFICHNSVIYEQLQQLHPLRKKDIFFLPHGVSLPDNFRKHNNEPAPLKLLFLGRMSEFKGIFDLPVISEILRKRNVHFSWTCIGSGPQLAELKTRWHSEDPVQFVSPHSNAEVMEICAENDVFVLPTKFEGSPVSLLETMSAGLVPVISRLPGGITDTVTEDLGFAVPMNDNEGFANAIETLYHDREKLNRMSMNCRAKIVSHYHITDTAAAYHRLFLRYREFYKEKKCLRIKVGARLDQPYLPSVLVKAIRSITNKLR